MKRVRGLVGGCGNNAYTVGAERRAMHPTRMPRECCERRAGLGVPDSRGLVVGCGDDARAVRAERRALHRIRMPQLIRVARLRACQ